MLDYLWPPEGPRCVVTFKGKGKPKHHWVGSAEEAMQVAERADRAGADVYFGLASFGSPSRKADNASLVRAFWLDIDCGEGKPYADSQVGLRALYDWLVAQRVVSPSYVVLSGSGLHCYWGLQQPITPDQWRPVAEQLKRACIATGLRADPVRTADLASILRVPGTHNYKSDPPAEVEVLAKGRPVEFEDFRRSLPMVGPIGAVPKGKRVPSEFDIVYNYDPADAAIIETKCAQMRAIKAVGGAVEEPLWRAALSIISRCEGGDTLIHDWSRGDPRYDPTETAAKAEGTVGPATCEYFASLNPPGCVGCPFSGKIRSPINLGSVEAEPPPRPGDSPSEDRINALGPYRVSAKGVFLHAEEEAGTEPPPPRRITHCPLWVLEVREREREDHESDYSILRLGWHAVDGSNKRADLPQEFVYDTKTFVKWLASNNLIAQVADVKGLIGYISMYTRELMTRRQVRKYYDRMGWHGDAFIWGKQAVSASNVRPVAVSDTTGKLVGLQARGSAEAWAKETAVLADPLNAPLAFTVLASLASPVLYLVNRTSAVLSLTGQTNRGKTLALCTALSVYGDYSLLIQAGNSTPNAVDLAMGQARHLPHGLDELTNLKGPALGAYIYSASDGRPRDRVNRTATRRQSLEWALVPLVTSNRAISEFSSSDINTAQRARVLEFTLERLVPKDTVVDPLVRALTLHGGSVAVPYLQALCQNRETVQAAFDAVDEMILARGVPEEFRYGRHLIAAAAVAGTIARRIGVILWDPAPVIDAAIARLRAQAHEVPSDENLLLTTISEFVALRPQDVCFWSSEKGAMAVHIPTRETIARYDKLTDTLAIPVVVLQPLLSEKAVSVKNVSTWLSKQGVGKSSIRLTPQSPAIWCYSFPCRALGLQMSRED